MTRYGSMLVALLVLASGCDAVVGAQCAAGLTWCHGVCAVTCNADGGAADGGAADGDAADASAADGEAADGGTADGAASSDGSAPADGDVGPDASADSGVLCDPPLVDCGGECVDLTSDPDHCGSCPNYCGTGLCTDSMCVGGYPGHVVLLGHDYTTSRAAMQRVIGNAVFLAPTGSVEVLVWEGSSTATARAGTDAAITASATTLGRTWARTAATTSADVVARLPSSDALLVYAQYGSTDSELDALGASWAPALATFLERGGVVVVTDTVSPDNAGTYQLLRSAGLLACSGATDISRTTVSVRAPADAVALGVPLTYRAEPTSVRFTTADGTDVIGDATGPVVVHLTVTP